MNESNESSKRVDVESSLKKAVLLAYEVMVPHVVQESIKAGSLQGGLDRLDTGELYADIMQVIVYFESLSSLLTGGDAVKVLGSLGIATAIGAANYGWLMYRGLRDKTVTSNEES